SPKHGALQQQVRHTQILDTLLDGPERHVGGNRGGHRRQDDQPQADAVHGYVVPNPQARNPLDDVLIVPAPIHGPGQQKQRNKQIEAQHRQREPTQKARRLPGHEQDRDSAGDGQKHDDVEQMRPLFGGLRLRGLAGPQSLEQEQAERSNHSQAEALSQTLTTRHERARQEDQNERQQLEEAFGCRAHCSPSFCSSPLGSAFCMRPRSILRISSVWRLAPSAGFCPAGTPRNLPSGPSCTSMRVLAGTPDRSGFGRFSEYSFDAMLPNEFLTSSFTVRSSSTSKSKLSWRSLVNSSCSFEGSSAADASTKR